MLKPNRPLRTGRIVAVAAIALLIVAGLASDCEAQEKKRIKTGKAAGIGALIGFALGGDVLGGAALGAAGSLIYNEVQKGKKEKAAGRQSADWDSLSAKERELAEREARLAALEAQMAQTVQAAEQTEASFIELIGPDNWEGYKALRACQWDRANAYAAVAATSTNEDFYITSVYLRAAVAVEQGESAKANAVFDEIAEIDDQVDSAQQANLVLEEVILDMHAERRDLGIVCP